MISKQCSPITNQGTPAQTDGIIAGLGHKGNANGVDMDADQGNFASHVHKHLRKKTVTFSRKYQNLFWIQRLNSWMLWRESSALPRGLQT